MAQTHHHKIADALTPELAYEGLVGAILATLRKRQNMTQKVLAEKVKIARSTLSSIENGKMSITIEELFMITRGLGTTPIKVLSILDQVVTCQLSFDILADAGVQEMADVLAAAG